MTEKNCIFCKIVDGEIPSKTIYTDDLFHVFLDVSPATKGHILIVTKEHFNDLYELPEEIAKEVMVLAKKMANLLKENLKCEGVNIIQNNGLCAGQTVFHYHLHIIPRFIKDGQKISWEPSSPTNEELESIMNLLSQG